jgi:uncharacterized phiE125 gp8 family phage protein
LRSLIKSSISGTEPIDSTQVNLHLKIQTTIEDSLIDTYIKAARIQCENIIKRALVPTSFALYMDSFKDVFSLPRPPISATAADVVITYINDTGGTSTVSSTNYDVDYNSEPGRVFISSSGVWPTDIMSRENAVKVSYKSGYTTATLPANVRTWLLMRVGIMYKHREPIIDGRPPAYLARNFLDGLLDDEIVIDPDDYST